ncbi:putative transposase [Thermosporothrix hazakensis]|jgi:putative transposase|uniref:Putative transposase n=1 Tax=Thermosporothrix hazakensis TaxID=644383 RepID=A0A326U234_THEHA|nr:RNA-guided endonuclease TnpB family protein [Thermosporothrix hazakensis]PZW25329.1 putative transposase [Thermosporothrix hazakensis]GCE50560.1 transposase [Thermosporothrix hazakensis]
MKQKRAYKYRISPTDEQKHRLARTFGCVRFVFNWALRQKTDASYNEHKWIYYKDLSEMLTALKKQDEYAWLNDASSVSLQQRLRHLEKAFITFFEGRAQCPTFKKKRHQQSATYTSNAFVWRNGMITLARMNEPLDIRWSRPLPDGSKPSSVTVSKDSAERSFISILVEEDSEHLPPSVQSVGADLGLKSLVVLSAGEMVGNPKCFAKDEKKLAKAQRRHAKKKKGSNKARKKVARIHARIADRRRDFLQKLSTRLIRENQTICVETLAVKNMVKNEKLAKAISDVGWPEWVSQLEYKANWYGRTLVKMDRWYPSRKRCCACGHLLDALALDVREWTCPACEVHHDRDINAAKNMVAAGLAVSACGEAVRPDAVKTKAGTPRRSRKARP